MTRGSSPENPGRRIFMSFLVYCIVSLFYDVSVLSPALHGIVATSMARYSLFVLKLPLNTNKPTNHVVKHHHSTKYLKFKIYFLIL